MQSDGIAKQIARWVALGALFLIPLAPLFGAGMFFPFDTGSFFFPFITGKAFFLRIVIEIAVCAWAVLALLDKRYRPRVSAVGVAVIGFVLWMFIADLFAVNVAKAFWSNFERMEGWVLLIHLLGLFFAASAILRVEKKWRAWFLTSLAVSVVISGYALLQLVDPKTFPIHQGSTRIDASLGNSIYLAIYLLFNVFIAGWLALTEKLAWLKWSLIALAVLEGILVFFTETRGTTWALIGALGLAALLTALTAGKRARGWAVLVLAGIVILTGSFYLARNSSFVQNNHVLQRVASISWADLQVRRTIWHMALQGTMERPLTGWGQEGFNYVFNKYYDPSLYQQEQWFDRAHNAFIDWLSAGGIPAFLLYLSLFGSAIVLLWKSSELSRPERIALTAALVGYAVHNLFVFDNLYSYIYFFALLALIDSQVGQPFERLEQAPELSSTDGATYALPIAAVSLIALMWFVNVPGMGVATKLITALSPSATGLRGNLATFQELTVHPAFAAQEVREQLVSFAESVMQSSQATTAEKQQVFSFAVSEMQKQIASYPLDAREHLELSYVYRTGGDSADALKEIQAARALSPSKEEIWIEAGTVEWNLGDVKAAQIDFNTAYTLGPQFQNLALYAAAGDIAAGDLTTADKILQSAYGTTSVDSDVLVVAYYRAKNWPRLISMLQARTQITGADVKTWFSLAAAYYESGDKANAIKTINTAVATYPDAAASGASALKQIETGTVGQ